LNNVNKEDIRDYQTNLIKAYFVDGSFDPIITVEYCETGLFDESIILIKQIEIFNSRTRSIQTVPISERQLYKFNYI
jgi:hypothetical protein